MPVHKSSKGKASGKRNFTDLASEITPEIDLKNDAAKKATFSPAEFKKAATGQGKNGVAAVAGVNGVKNKYQGHLDQSKTVLVNGDALDVSMDDADSDDEDSEDEDPSDAEDDHESEARQDQIMKDATRDTSPSQALVPVQHDPIDVSSALVQIQPSSALVSTFTDLAHNPAPGTSLATVVSQSLRTNDSTLLETCLSSSDELTISTTVQRLDSSLAAALLQKLAERLHRRPGRAGSLMVWVQWTLVAHGGYLATRPEIVKDLASLHKVISERTKSLKPLLALKGRLDMLDAQMRLRQNLQSSQKQLEGNTDQAVVYVEGEEEDSDSSSEEGDSETDESEDEEEIQVAAKGRKTKTPKVNGINHSLNEVASGEDNSDDDEEDILIDDEASVTSRDTGSDIAEDEIDIDDVDSSAGSDSGSDDDSGSEASSDDMGSLKDFIAEESEDGEKEDDERPAPKKRRR
jgi:U3 small nucleolar RNA-associated protein 5